MRVTLKSCLMTKKKSEPKVLRRSIFDYLPDDHNANAGTERGLQMVEYSLGKVGVGRSIVADKNGKIPAGNKTLEAAINKGFEDVLEIEDDGKTLIIHKRSDWDLDDPTGAAREYAYLDNRAGEEGLAWDANVIAADVQAGLNFNGIFTPGELDYILNPVISYAEGERGQNPDERLDIFMNATIKQVVLLFDNEQYKQVMEALAIIRKAERVETNTEAFLRMLAVYEKHQRLTQGA